MAEYDYEGGVNPNDNVAHLVYIPSAVFVVVCPVLMALRFWARLRRNGTVGADDWTAVAALVRDKQRGRGYDVDMETDGALT
jgi:hypothetical protein